MSHEETSSVCTLGCSSEDITGSHVQSRGRWWKPGLPVTHHLPCCQQQTSMRLFRGDANTDTNSDVVLVSLNGKSLFPRLQMFHHRNDCIYNLTLAKAVEDVRTPEDVQVVRVGIPSCFSPHSRPSPNVKNCHGCPLLPLCPVPRTQLFTRSWNDLQA